MLMGVTSWELGALRVPLIMVPDNIDSLSTEFELTILNSHKASSSSRGTCMI
jgi:hypothetical protein